MEEIIQFDKQLLLMVNGSDSVFLDYVVLTLTNAKTWIPLYLGLFYVVVMTHKPNWRDILLILAAAGLCVLLAGTIDDTIVKPLVARWRPTHDPQIGALVDVVNDYRGGNYGFFSAHAANTFSIALFFSLLMRHRLFVPSDSSGVLWWAMVSIASIVASPHQLATTCATSGCPLASSACLSFTLLFALPLSFMHDTFLYRLEDDEEDGYDEQQGDGSDDHTAYGSHTQRVVAVGAYASGQGQWQ